jgi:hypothetical protein
MSTRIQILKDGVIKVASTANDRQLALNSLVSTLTANRVLRSNGTNIVLSQIDLATDVTGVLPPANGGFSGSASFVDLTTAQSIGGLKTFSEGLILPASSHTTVGTIWRNGANLEFRNSANTTQIILNSAGNLSNLSDKQVSLNNLVGAVTSGNYLRGNGSNVTLSAIQASDVPTLNQNTTGTSSNVTGLVAIGNGGTGSNTKVWVDLSTDQSISGIKTFTNTTQSTSTTTGGVIVLGGFAVQGNQFIGGFTSLGNSSFPIKTLYLTGTSGATDGSTVNIAHGLTVGKILTATALLEYATGNFIASNYTVSAGYQYDVIIAPANVAIQLKAGNSANIVNKPVRIFIVYTS